MTEAGSLLLFIVALPLLLLVAAVVVRMWEKRLVWPYLPAEPATTPATAYMKAIASAAQSAGFVPCGVFRDGKGSMYKIRYELWLAPERDALLLVGGGRMAGIPVDASWLFTRLSNGRCIATLDNEAGSEFDLAGVIDEAVHPRAPLETLLQIHRRAVAAAEVPALPYSNASAEHRELLCLRIRNLVHKGYANFSGETGEWWRYSTRGALAATLASYWAGVRRGLRRKTAATP
jgi:hypothetical protein